MEGGGDAGEVSRVEEVNAVLMFHSLKALLLYSFMFILIVIIGAV